MVYYFNIQDPIRCFKSPNKLVIYYLRIQKINTEQLLASAYMLYLYKLHMLQFKDLRVDQWIKPCISVNTRELDGGLCTWLSILYT